MNKRIAKKKGHGRSFYQTIETSEGPTLVHVNRRGCKGPWTEDAASALQALVEAVRAQYKAGKLPATSAGDGTP
jgi:hypothetical protein